jgi:hypothetical protein
MQTFSDALSFPRWSSDESEILVKGTAGQWSKATLLPAPTPASVAEHATDHLRLVTLRVTVLFTKFTRQAAPASLWCTARHLRAVCDEWCICTMNVCSQRLKAELFNVQVQITCSVSLPVTRVPVAAVPAVVHFIRQLRGSSSCIRITSLVS